MKSNTSLASREKPFGWKHEHEGKDVLFFKIGRIIYAKVCWKGMTSLKSLSNNIIDSWLLSEVFINIKLTFFTFFSLWDKLVWVEWNIKINYVQTDEISLQVNYFFKVSFNLKVTFYVA